MRAIKVGQFLRIALCARWMLQSIPTQAISYRSAFLPIISSTARACPAVVEFTFKAKPVGATHGRHGVSPSGGISRRRGIPPSGGTPCDCLRHYRLFKVFPPEWVRMASGLFQSFATALTRRVDAQRMAAVLP